MFFVFKYEDMDYQSLSTSLDIENPDGPEELYALAQFCRMGKGIQASEENYRLYLQRAADAGSEQARSELDGLNAADTLPDAPPAPAEARTLQELLQAESRGDPYALLELAQKAQTPELLDLPKAKQWLEKAASLILQGVYRDEEAKQIYLSLARLLQNPAFDTPENRTECHRYYGMAAELGSAEACDILAEQYKTGYGCTPDPEKAAFYRERGTLKDDPAYLCRQCSKLLQENGSRMEVAVKLAHIRSLSQDPQILNYANLLAAAAGQEAPDPAAVEWAWQHTDDAEIVPLLLEIYGTDPRAAADRNLPLTNDRLVKLGFLQIQRCAYDAALPWVRYAADAGDTDAMSNLGLLYENGQGVPQDCAKAAELYQKAADAGDTRALKYLGVLYNNGRGVPQDYAKAAELFQKAADAGNSDAMNNLGVLYLNGRGIPQDYAKAAELYQKAADAGDTDAMSNLGLLYENGRGVPQDCAKAAELYQKAADAGNPRALKYLGVLYKNGWGVPQDYAKAAALFQKAVDAGVTTAIFHLGVLYKNGQGVPQDFAKAAALLQKAVDAGDFFAMYPLGVLYANGRGVSQDCAKAAELYQKAADAGHPDAMNDLGTLYENGQGVRQDYAKAAALYQKAADAGHTVATYNLAVLYANGRGVRQDCAKAAALYQKAADAGNTKAMYNLAVLYGGGQGVSQDFDKAAALFRKVADAGNTDAAFHLGVLYENGNGVPQNYAKAAALYQKAADAGHTEAKYYLAVLYKTGNGVARNYAKAAALFQEAARGGIAAAMYNMGYLYENGLGVAMDLALAEKNYRAAAEAGSPQAQAWLKSNKSGGLYRWVCQNLHSRTKQEAYGMECGIAVFLSILLKALYAGFPILPALSGLLMALNNICIVAALWIAGKAWICEGLSVLNSGLITGPIMLVSYTFRKISQKYKDGHRS